MATAATPPTPRARDKVFHTPELIENIILNLPLRRILLITRVNSTFYSAVEDSKFIRRALFLEPATEKDGNGGGGMVEWFPRRWDAEGKFCAGLAREVREWLEEHGRGMQSSGSEDEESEGEGDGSLDWEEEEYKREKKEGEKGVWRSVGSELLPVVDGVVVNPFLALHWTAAPTLHRRQWYRDRLKGLYFNHGETLALEGPGYGHRSLAISRDPLRGPRPSQLLSEMNHSTSTFANMLVTQPPIRKVFLNQSAYSPPPGETDAGLTMYNLFSAAMYEAQQPSSDKERVRIAGGELWTVLRNTVDEITGWEMLWVLGRSGDELEEKGMVQGENGASWPEWKSRFRAEASSDEEEVNGDDDDGDENEDDD